jgi:hypothetical protein
VQGEVQSQGGLSGGTQNGEVRSDKSGARSDTSAGEALKMNSEKSGASSSGPLQGETSKSASGPLSPLHVGGASSARLQGGTSTNGPLHGHVTGSGTVLPAFKLRMSEAQLKEAVAQYASDLRQFYLHVTDYHANQVALKKQIGECTENEQQWQLKLQKDKLKLNSVVIATGVPNLPPPPATPPDIPPPRVCCARCLITGRCGAGHLGPNNMGGGGVTPPGTLSEADKARMRIAAQDLAKTEGNLQIANQENSFTSQKAINEAEIEQSQQSLAEKFGRLQQEFDMLKIEKEALTGARVK